jgi:surface polysaccharide O-acyltransferase-like enzyme
MNVQAKIKRNPGIDLLRCLAMFYVIILHFIGQGGLLAHAEAGSVKFWVLSAVQILTICCVNLYGLTTGYLMCDKPFKLSRVVKLWVTTVFWSVAVSCVLFVVFPETRTFEEVVSMFLPILRGRYWFFTAYVVVMLLSPVLNLVIRSLSKGQFHLLLAVLFLLFGVIPVGSLGYDVMRISTGHHFSWMISLYVIGGYLRRFACADTINRNYWMLGYFGFALIHLLYKYAVMAVGMTGFADLLLTYPSPLTVGESVCLFLYFKEAFSDVSAESVLGKLIRFAAPGIYSVYVIHVHPKVYWNADIIALFHSWDNWNTVTVCAAMLGTATALFAVCVCLDAVRQRLFRAVGIDRAVDRLSNYIENKVRTLLGD